MKKMNFKVMSKKEFISNNYYDAIFVYGAGNACYYLGEVFGNTEIMNKIIGFVDRDPDKQERRIDIAQHHFRVFSPDIFKIYAGRKIAVIISCVKFEPILEQFRNMAEMKNADVFLLHHFDWADADERAMNKKLPKSLKLTKTPEIPKVIHYCWFGGNPIPDNYKKWMESWQKFNPDYEIKEWNESNYDVTKNLYMYQAYEQKKWGFVPDYARLDIIYNHGGIYLDTDVEVVKSFDDMLYQKGFAGFESDKFVALGLGFGAVPGLPIIKEMLDYYEDKAFINDDGTLNLIASPHMQTDVLSEYGLQKNGEYQVVADMTIFPEKMFCGKSERLRRIRCNEYTHSIHHYDGSWLDEESKKINKSKEAVLDTANEKDYTYDKKKVHKCTISVIVIVYNVEDYLEECIDSIINQKYKNLEIILVDDGSTDKSGKICDSYAKKDSRVKVVHKKNGGLVSARQAGVEVATGKYVTFVDGDDWIDEEMYEELIDYAEGYKADVVASGINRNFEDRVKTECNLIPNGYYTKQMMEEDVYPFMMFDMKKMNHYVDPSLCNKLFSLKAIKPIILDVEKEIFYLGEDAATTYPFLLKAKNMYVTDRAFYHHRIINVTKKVSEYKDDKVFERLNIWYHYVKTVFEKSKYKKIMLPQLDLYYAIKLNQLSIRGTGVDFLQLFSRYWSKPVSSNLNVRYVLPEFEELEGKKIVLYGAGAVGKEYDRQLRHSTYNMVGWIDKNYEYLQKTGWPVKSVDELSDIEFDIILVATTKRDLYVEIKSELIKKGISEELIIWGRPSNC